MTSTEDIKFSFPIAGPFLLTNVEIPRWNFFVDNLLRPSEMSYILLLQYCYFCLKQVFIRDSPLQSQIYPLPTFIILYYIYYYYLFMPSSYNHLLKTGKTQYVYSMTAE